MVLNLSDYRIEVFREQTESYYAEEQTIYDSDPNDDTKNFVMAISGIDKDVQVFFKEIGVDIKKPIEMFLSYEEGPLLVYEGYYHICGNILSGTAPWMCEDNSNLKILDESVMHPIGKSFLCGFSEECTLLYEGFPQPAIQMEVIITLPRVYKNP